MQARNKHQHDELDDQVDMYKISIGLVSWWCPVDFEAGVTVAGLGLG